MNIFGFVTRIFKPAADLIDALHTSEEERLQVKAKLLEVQAGLVDHVLELEKEKLKAQSAIIVAEAKSESWLTRTWRPIVMLWLAGLAGAHWMGLTPEGLSAESIDDLFDIVKIGIGGYVGGRSVEKAVGPVVAALKSKEK